MTQIAYSDQTISYGYDAGTNGVGRLTGASDANHSMAWTYDSQGHVTGKSQIVGGVTKALGYGYTNDDLTSMVTPSGQTVTYGYTNHRVTSIAVNGTTILSGVSYDPFGPATGWTWGNGTTVSRAYDLDGNPHQIVTAGVTYGYTVDNASRISAISDSGTASDSFAYGYDVLDRVTSGISSGITGTYTYASADPVSNVDPLGLADCSYSVSTHTLSCVPNAGGKSLPLGPNGVFSWVGKCQNQNSCSNLHDLGPIPPGNYNMNPDDRPGHQGFWRLEPNPQVPGWRCMLGLNRCGFELHPGGISLGCITVNKNDPTVMNQYKKINTLLNHEVGDNHLRVVP